MAGLLWCLAIGSGIPARAGTAAAGPAPDRRPSGNPPHWETFDLRSPHGVPALETYANDPVVRLDAELDEGQPLLPDGTPVGQYRFHPIGEPGAVRGYILRIAVPTPAINTHGHLFVCDRSRGRFEFFGHYEATPLDSLDPTRPFYAALLRLVFEPAAFDLDDLRVLASQASLEPPMSWAASFHNTFYPFLVKALARALAAEPENPAFTEANSQAAGNVLRSIRMETLDRLSPRQLQAVATRVEELWPDLRFGPRFVLLAYLTGGNTATRDITARLTVQWLDQLHPEALAPFEPADQIRLNLFDSLLWSLDLNGHLGVHAPPQRPLISAGLAAWLKLPDPSFLQSSRAALYLATLATGGDLNYDLTPDLTAYRQLASRYLRSYVDSPRILLLVASDLLASGAGGFLGPAEFAAIDQALPEGLAGWTPDEAYRIIHLYHPNLPETGRTRLAGLLSALDYGALVPAQWQMFETVPSEAFARLPADLQERILQACGTALRKAAPARGEGADVWSGEFDHAFAAFLRLLAGNPSFASLSDLVLDVVPHLNPRQPGESDEEHRRRLEQVGQLWLRERLFLQDLGGGSRVRPAYLQVLADFARTCPDWMQVCVLASSEGGEAKPGVAQFNWRDRYTTPFLLAESLYHESGHSLQLDREPRLDLVDATMNHWHSEADWSDPGAFPSDYARTNPFEFWAEYTRYWHLDSRRWLRQAIENYRSGSPAMLNLFLLVATSKRPTGLPEDDTLPLFTLGADGLQQLDSIPARWRRGDARDGEFEFEFDLRTYQVRYRRRLVSGVLESGVPIGPDPIPPDPAPVTLTAERLAGSGFRLVVNGPPGSDYVIQASTDLRHWTDDVTHRNPTPPFLHQPAAAEAPGLRAFRVRLEPP
jgi:hypothetical protein